jgi:hypothetical protein
MKTLSCKNQENPSDRISHAWEWAPLSEGACAADFSLLNLPKGKSLGRSKPATNS